MPSAKIKRWNGGTLMAGAILRRWTGTSFSPKIVNISDLRQGPTGGSWVSRNAGAWGYVIPYWGPTSGPLFSLPAGSYYSLINPTFYSYGSNDGGIEAPDKSGSFQSLVYNGGPVGISITFGQNYSGVVSLYAFDDGQADLRSSNVAIAVDGVEISTGQMTGYLRAGIDGRWFEWDITAQAGATVTWTLSGSPVNNVFSGLMLA